MVIFRSAESWLYALQLPVAEGVQTPNLSSSQMITHGYEQPWDGAHLVLPHSQATSHREQERPVAG